MRVYNDPSRSLRTNPAGLFLNLRQGRLRLALIINYQKLRRSGVSTAKAMAALNIKNINVIRGNSYANTNKRLSRLWARAVAMCGRQSWPSDWDSLEALCETQYCNSDMERRFRAERDQTRRKELEWRDDGPAWKGGKPLRTYHPRQQELYAQAYEELSQGIVHNRKTEHDRLIHWRHHKEGELRRKVGVWSEMGATAQEITDWIFNQKLYFLANGFTWSEVWDRVEQITTRKVPA